MLEIPVIVEAGIVVIVPPIIALVGAILEETDLAAAA
jgi:hypothetical protein